MCDAVHWIQSTDAMVNVVTNHCDWLIFKHVTHSSNGISLWKLFINLSANIKLISMIILWHTMWCPRCILHVKQTGGWKCREKGRRRQKTNHSAAANKKNRQIVNLFVTVQMRSCGFFHKNHFHKWNLVPVRVCWLSGARCHCDCPAETVAFVDKVISSQRDINESFVYIPTGLGANFRMNIFDYSSINHIHWKRIC